MVKNDCKSNTIHMTASNRKERKKEERRKEIIRAAERLFYVKGFDKVTMDEIAREVDVSKGSLYLHFKNKNSLFFGIVAQMHKESMQLLEERLNPLTTGGEKIREICQWYIDIARANPEYTEMATTYGPRIWSQMDSEDEQSLAENAVRYNILLNAAISTGIEDGTIRDDLDPRILGFYVTFISMTVASPLPAWKKGIALSGVTFDQFLNNFTRFIEPSITGSREKK